MITSLSQLDLNKRYSYAEYLTWQFQERLELIKGKIFKMSPAPDRSHQRTSMELSFQIRNYLSGKDCYIYTAPFDVRFPKSQGDENKFTVVQPDICIVCDKLPSVTSGEQVVQAETGGTYERDGKVEELQLLELLNSVF